MQPAKAPRMLMTVLSREEVDRMEVTAQTERDKLIVRLLADTGLRASELLGMKARDLVQGVDKMERNWYEARRKHRRLPDVLPCARAVSQEH